MGDGRARLQISTTPRRFERVDRAARVVVRG
jgi:hypothetical protein